MKKYFLPTFFVVAIIGFITFQVTCTMADDTKNEKNPQYVISVKAGNNVLGDITVELFPDKAPKTVHNFDSLVAIKFFDGTAFHRVIDNFMIQGGDPNSKSKPKNTWGMGDPSQTKVPAEFNDTKHIRGVISMARSNDPNSASSQFFIMHGDAPHLDGQYTAFGKVIDGIGVVDEVVAQPKSGSAPNEKIEMTIRKK
jgi:cyclophilin family peptidyl-prolyl cis-trans isomerase